MSPLGRRIRTALGLVAAATLALGLTGTPATADAPAPRTADLSKVSLHNVNNNRYLDVQNGNQDPGAIIVTNSAPGYQQNWRINAVGNDGSFTLVNTATGKCVTAGVPLRQQQCGEAGDKRWYFQPVAVNGATTNAFMVRNAGNNKCLDVVLGATYDDAWTQTYDCNGSRAQQWTLPDQTTTDAAFDLAVDYAAFRCGKNASTCSWTKGSQTPAAPLPKQCVSPVWYNGTSAPVPWTFSLTTVSGWSTEIGFGLTSTLEGGGGELVPLKVNVAQTVSGKVSMSLSQELGNSLTVTVPQQQYGWVALSELATKVSGEWTFDATGMPWTAQDTVTVPLTSGEGGASVYMAQTSDTFTGCGS
ncbi:RICIN domain-containing protein [Streptomyces sp. NPDC015032]|uniref:RICIN domain-containing protein n=1 Tax=Streptomyces sp. NPDC015032 TaxID=3364937 RepID=UPI0036F7B1C9